MPRPNLARQYSKEAFVSKNTRLSEGEALYIELLTQRKAGMFSFRTSSERILAELQNHWPALEHGETTAREFCNKITGALMPFVNALPTRDVEITATISAAPVHAPEKLDPSMGGVVYDCAEMVERVCSLSPHRALLDAAQFSIPKGISVICRPLFDLGNKLNDASQPTNQPDTAAFKKAQRLINEMYESPDYIGEEKDILKSVKGKIDELMNRLESEEAAEDAAAEATMPQPHPGAPAPVLRTGGNKPSLQPLIQALGNLLLYYTLDTKVSATMRAQFRQIVQSLIAISSQASMTEALRHEPLSQATTAPEPVNTAPARPVAVDVEGDSGEEEHTLAQNHPALPQLTE